MPPGKSQCLTFYVYARDVIHPRNSALLYRKPCPLPEIKPLTSPKQPVHLVVEKWRVRYSVIHLPDNLDTGDIIKDERRIASKSKV